MPRARAPGHRGRASARTYLRRLLRSKSSGSWRMSLLRRDEDPRRRDRRGQLRGRNTNVLETVTRRHSRERDAALQSGNVLRRPRKIRRHDWRVRSPCFHKPMLNSLKQDCSNKCNNSRHKQKLEGVLFVLSPMFVWCCAMPARFGLNLLFLNVCDARAVTI